MKKKIRNPKGGRYSSIYYLCICVMHVQNHEDADSQAVIRNTCLYTRCNIILGILLNMQNECAKPRHFAYIQNNNLSSTPIRVLEKKDCIHTMCDVYIYIVM